MTPAEIAAGLTKAGMRELKPWQARMLSALLAVPQNRLIINPDVSRRAAKRCIAHAIASGAHDTSNNTEPNK